MIVTESMKILREINCKRLLTQLRADCIRTLQFSTSADDPIVKIEDGLVKGTTGKDYDNRTFYKFLGVPYAKPPIGNLRFKPPQPADKWEGIKDATKDGSESYSRDFFKGIIGSEDCLFLNVYTPQLPKTGSKLKPVMVWIHGGGFVWGSNNSKIYGPEFLITEDAVIVAINYRLGILGFLSLENPELGVTGNAACKDMVLALKWVQNNIKYFGGDPRNVTIFGQSAGGVAVHLLMLSSSAKGLFHRAIAQSGSAINTWSMCKPFQNELKKLLQCPYDNEKDTLKYFQEVSLEKLFAAQEKLRDRFHPKFVRSIGPTIEKISEDDGAFLNRHPIDIIVEGSYTKVPLMMGYTSREAFFLITMSGKQTDKDKLYINFERYVPNFLDIQMGSDLSKDIANKIKKFYFGEEIPAVKDMEKYYLLQGDSIFVRGVYSSIKNHLFSSTHPLYLYRFSVDAALNIYKLLRQINLPGASHADDLGYLFKSQFAANVRPNSVEEKTIRRMVKFWVNFAKTGNPNSVENVSWNPVTKDKLNFLDIGNELVEGVNPDQERMQFWDEIFNLTQSSSRF